MSARITTPYAGPIDVDMEPDDDTMFRFLGWWFGGCNRGAIELCWREPFTGAWDLVRRFGLDDLEAAVRFAADTNAVPGASMYFRAATIRPDAYRTTDGDVMQVPGTYTDCDDPESVQRVLASPIAASAQIITGRLPVLRSQFYYKLGGDPIIVGAWSRHLNRQAHALSGGDPMVVNPSTLMRLPGSIAWPWKAGRQPELTEWVTPEGGGQNFTLDALRHSLPQVSAEYAGHNYVNGGGNGHANGGVNGHDVRASTELLNPIRALVEHAKSGGPGWHNAVLSLTGRLVSRGTPRAVILAMAADLTQPGYTIEQTRSEMAEMIDSAIRKGFKPEDQCENEGGNPGDSKLDDPDVDDLDIEEDVMSVPPKADIALFPLLTEDALEAMPDPVWLIEDLLVANTLCVLYGPWGSFKSFVALHIALCLATGMDFFGQKVVKSDTLYIAGEGAGGIKKRLAAWKKHHGHQKASGFRVVPVAINLLDKAEAKRLIRTVIEDQKATGFNPKLVIVDTLHRSMPGGDENTAKEMGIVVSNGAHIQLGLGCALMPVHHSGKDFERGMRGSTGLPGACDTILRMTRDGAGDKAGDKGTLLVEKQKDGEDGQEYYLATVAIDLPPASGSIKPRNSLVMVKAEGQPTRGGNRLNQGERKAKQILADLVAVEGRPLPCGGGFPSATFDQPLKGVQEDRWREECEIRRLSTAEKGKSRNLAFRRAYEGLLQVNEVATRDGIVWLSKKDKVAAAP